jgi:hypothetical protein
MTGSSVRFWVLSSVLVGIRVFWDMRPFRLVNIYPLSEKLAAAIFMVCRVLDEFFVDCIDPGDESRKLNGNFGNFLSSQRT